MSRQAHLPPRCPFQKKTISGHNPVSQTLNNGTYLHPRHHRSGSQSSIVEEKPAWLDDLLDDSDSNSGGILHRRSASDSLTLLDDLVPLTSLNQLSGSDTPTSYETDGRLESAAIYGPNSPRAKGKTTFPENAIVSALSEYVSHEQFWHLNESICISGTANLDSVEDTCGSAGEIIAETKPVKRSSGYASSPRFCSLPGNNSFDDCGHNCLPIWNNKGAPFKRIKLKAAFRHVFVPTKSCKQKARVLHSGQRSRVRKLQYIAELERTVNFLQKVETDMASRIASLVQQHLTLSLENKKLMQRAVRLQQEKQIVDGQYKSLRNEVERLKTSLAYVHGNKVSTNFRLSSSAELANTEATWQMLDMGKLDLN